MPIRRTITVRIEHAELRKSRYLLGLIMKNNSISIRINEMKERKCPRIPDDEKFADWVSELREMDGYVVGLAMQVESGQSIDGRSLIKNYADFRNAFGNFSKTHFSDDDQVIYEECREYMSLLDGLVDVITPSKGSVS